jgi:integrase
MATSQASFSVKTPPKKLTNAERRSREYLTPHEVEQVLAAARKVGRHPHHDATLMLCMYRHGVRVAEAVSLRWEAVDFQAGCLHVHRIKHGHPFIPICSVMPVVFIWPTKGLIPVRSSSTWDIAIFSTRSVIRR